MKKSDIHSSHVTNAERLQQVAQAAFLNIDRYTIAIGNEPPGSSPGIGSGVMFELGDERLWVATAAHVLDGHSMEELVIAAPQKEGDDYNTSRRIEIKSTWHNENYKKDRLDIGWLELTPEANRWLEPGKSFLDFHRFKRRISDLEDELVVVSGFPSSIAEMDPTDRKISANPALMQLTPFLPNGAEELASAEWDLFFKYPDRGYSVEDLSKVDAVLPPGMSGGGIWATHINDDASRPWVPDEHIKLIGLMASWNRPDNWVQGIKVTKLIDLFIGVHPDYAESLSAIKDR